MPSRFTLLKVAMLTTAFMALQSAHGPARAGEEAGPALQASVAQSSAIAELRGVSGDSYDQLQPSIPPEVDLVTGDGQQGSVSGTPIACVAPNAGCTP
jgi:hypothetical protein